jgi:hypothetical protein
MSGSDERSEAPAHVTTNLGSNLSFAHPPEQLRHVLLRSNVSSGEFMCRLTLNGQGSDRVLASYGLVESDDGGSFLCQPMCDCRTYA